MRSYGLSLLGAFRRAAVPLGAYYVVTLLIPVVNGAVGVAFVKHAIVVFLVPVGLIAAAHGLWRATRVVVRVCAGCRVTTMRIQQLSGGLLFVLWGLMPPSNGLPDSATAAEGFEQAANGRVNPAERLNTAVFSFDQELDKLYAREYERLSAVCEGRQDWLECRQRNLRPTSRRVAFVYRGPSTASAVVGELHAVLTVHASDGLNYAVEFRPRSANKKPVVWLESVGYRGYGIHVPGVRIKGDWLQLFGAPLPAESWVNGRSPSFGGFAESIEGSLVSLPAILATSPDGSRASIAAGSYLIERIRGSLVMLRQEVASDFPCREDVKAPTSMPPSLLIEAESLFDSTGAPLFSDTYPKGC